MNEHTNSIKMHRINNVFIHFVYLFIHLNWILLLLCFQYLEQEKKTREFRANPVPACMKASNTQKQGADLQKVRTYALYFSLGWCVKFKNKWWSPLVSQFEQETSVSVIGHVLLNSQPFQLYFCNHILLPNCGNFFVQKILMGSYFVYICTFHVQNFMMGFSEIVYNTQPGIRLTI